MPVQFVQYDPTRKLAVAQVAVDVYTAAPWNDSLTVSEVLSQLDSDYERPGFGGWVVESRDEVIGYSFWYDISGIELNDRWRPRFSPRDQVPTPAGRGVYFSQLVLAPSFRNKGLGKTLLRSSLNKMEPGHDWIALNAHSAMAGALALVKSHGFEELPLTSIRAVDRVCLMKTLRFPATTA